MSDPPSQIREMNAGDVEAIMPLMIQLGYEVNIGELKSRFGAIANTAGHHILVAELEGHMAGFCHMFARPALEKPPEAVLQSLVVDAAYRQDGIGRALVDAVEVWARAKGYASISLTSQVEREDAHAFYASLGYEKVATSSLLRKWLD